LRCPNSSPELCSGEFWAVHDVSFELKRGECLGLIEHNGAGKTTLLKMLNDLIKTDSGSLNMRELAAPSIILEKILSLQ
jgi:lipopolysaccharide transport system ATP-binding protein